MMTRSQLARSDETATNIHQQGVKPDQTEPVQLGYHQNVTEALTQRTDSSFTTTLKENSGVSD